MIFLLSNDNKINGNFSVILVNFQERPCRIEFDYRLSSDVPEHEIIQDIVFQRFGEFGFKGLRQGDGVCRSQEFSIGEYPKGVTDWKEYLNLKKKRQGQRCSVFSLICLVSNLIMKLQDDIFWFMLYFFFYD